MSMHLLTDTDGNAVPAPPAPDEILLDLIGIVRGARSWCEDTLGSRSSTGSALALHLRNAAAALVPVTPGAGGARSAAVRRAVGECRRSLDLAGDALDHRRVATPAARGLGRRGRCGVPRSAERAVALAVLHLAIVRAQELTDAAVDVLDVSIGPAGRLASIDQDRSRR